MATRVEWNFPLRYTIGELEPSSTTWGCIPLGKHVLRLARLIILDFSQGEDFRGNYGNLVRPQEREYILECRGIIKHRTKRSLQGSKNLPPRALSTRRELAKYGQIMKVV